MPIRYDTSRLDGAKVTENGFLKADAFPTRAGIFLYMNLDGTLRRELRHPREVFNPDSLATLAEIPMTNNHPREPVNAANARKYAVGFTGPSPKREGKDMVFCPITIFDEQTIKEVVSGEKQELSCGYFCDVDFTGGIDPDYGPYDSEQKKIRYNHLATVEEGRAGPEAKVKLDAMRIDASDKEFAVMVLDAKEKSSSAENPNPVISGTVTEDQNKTREKIMPVKIKIDSVEYELADAATAQAIMAKIDSATKLSAEVSDAKKTIETLTGQLDALKADSQKKDAEIADLKAAKLSDKELIAKADALVKVRDFGKKILGKDVKVDEMEIDSIKKAVLTKLAPAVKVDEKSADYIDAAFDMHLSLDSKVAGDNVRTAISDRAAQGADHQKPSEVRAAKMKADSERWKNHKGR